VAMTAAQMREASKAMRQMSNIYRKGAKDLKKIGGSMAKNIYSRGIGKVGTTARKPRLTKAQKAANFAHNTRVLGSSGKVSNKPYRNSFKSGLQSQLKAGTLSKSGARTALRKVAARATIAFGKGGLIRQGVARILKKGKVGLRAGGGLMSARGTKAAIGGARKFRGNQYVKVGSATSFRGRFKSARAGKSHSSSRVISRGRMGIGRY
jgi:hypothetical protein